ncbi:MAG: AraC family transcriptional regulator [Thiothrix lacustris]|uniref:AraC family transcriptional regulator n=1 Tax=Thiothrix lacustris TaxID=525917 RepID=A0A1Y1QW46_9GAMM|nr:MAG: AraC family transcriptional regulator [Thiothrix lacustris]
MQTLSTLLIGFSVFSIPLLALTHFRHEHYQGQATAQAMGIIVLIALLGLQLAYFVWLQTGTDTLHSPYYQVLLFTVAPTFYLFSKPLLQVSAEKLPRDLLHLLPILIAPFLPFVLAVSLAFVLGAGYCGWLISRVYATLRQQRSRFQPVTVILGAALALTLLVLPLGIGASLLPENVFFTVHASAIGLVLWLIHAALSIAPRLTSELAEVTSETQCVSTLAHVDCALMLAEVEGLMQEEELFRRPDLALNTLAERLGLSTQQLAELLQTRLGKSFSRYVCEFRVEAAEDRLLEEPDTSLQVVGLSVGFASETQFTDAFREISGMTPGQFRKINQFADHTRCGALLKS